MSKCICCSNRIRTENDSSVPDGGVQIFIVSPQRHQELAVILDRNDAVEFIRSLMYQAGISNITYDSNKQDSGV